MKHSGRIKMLMILLLEVETSTEHILEAHTSHSEQMESEKSELQTQEFQFEQSQLDNILQ